jgi:hypothetical protein
MIQSFALRASLRLFGRAVAALWRRLDAGLKPRSTLEATATTISTAKQLLEQKKKQISFGDDKQERQVQERLQNSKSKYNCKSWLDEVLHSHSCRGEAAT